MSPGGPPRYNSSPSPPARITPPPNTPPAASPGLTPAICRIIWWMKCWITLTPARATFAEEFSAALNERRVNRARHRRREWPDAAGGDRTPGCSCSGWMIPANGSAITRCLAASCASAVSGSWRLNYRRSTAPRRKAGWRKVSPARPSTMRWRPAMPKCCAISCSIMPGHV